MFGTRRTEAKYSSAAGTNDPWYTTCDAMGFPRSSLNEIRAVMFAQMPDRVLEVYQYSRLWREIMTNGEPLPKNVGEPGGPDPRWYGYSIGHWDGDNTLVVDTTGSDDRSWLDKEGHPHSVDAMIHETYERTSHNLMTNIITITDPQVYTKPFQISTIPYVWIPNQKFEEQICVPSEMISYRSVIGAPAGDWRPRRQKVARPIVNRNTTGSALPASNFLGHNLSRVGGVKLDSPNRRASPGLRSRFAANPGTSS